MKKIFLATLFFNSLLLAQGYDPTNDLFFAFGSRCQSKGPLNEVALNDGNSIKSIVESVRDDESCQSIVNALNSIDSLNVTRLMKDKNLEKDVEFLAMKSNDLEMALQAEIDSGGKDTAYITALKTELVATKVSVIKSQKSPQQENAKKRYETIDNFYSYSNVLFSKLKQSDQCLTKKPNLAAQIGAQILGMSSSLSSGVIGSLMLSAGSLTDNFISFFRDKSLGKKIKSV
jgi:uncharacterized membrane protein YkoI